MPTIQVVVLAYRDLSVGLELLRSLPMEGIEPDQVTLVLNAATTTGASDQVAAKLTRVISAESNLGYAGGMNLGIQDAIAGSADYILLLTHDVRLEPGCIAKLRDLLEREPGYGVVGPVLRSTDARLPFSAGGFVSRDGEVGHHVAELDASVEVSPVDWIDGSVMLVRAQVFGDAGMLDERFFMYCDEVEFCLRARRAGWKVGAVPAAVANQQTGADRRPGAFHYLQTRNGLEVARLVGGWRALAVTAGRLVTQVWELTRVSLGPHSPNDERVAARLSLRADLLGALDFSRGHWGPPDARLAGLGDVVLDDAAGRDR